MCQIIGNPGKAKSSTGGSSTDTVAATLKGSSAIDELFDTDGAQGIRHWSPIPTLVIGILDEIPDGGGPGGVNGGTSGENWENRWWWNPIGWGPFLPYTNNPIYIHYNVTSFTKVTNLSFTPTFLRPPPEVFPPLFVLQTASSIYFPLRFPEISYGYYT